MTEDSKAKEMLQGVEKGLGIPKGTSMWIWPRKPTSQPKTGAHQGKSPQKQGTVKGAKPSKSGKTRSGPKHRKHIFAGWD